MLKRNCPKCNKELGDHDSHFCTYCGEKLPKDLIFGESAIKTRTYSPSQPEVSKGPALARVIKSLSDPTMWSILGLVGFITLVFVGIAKTGVFELLGLKLQVSDSVAELNLPSFPSKSQSRSLPVGFMLPEVNFDSTNLSEHIPEEALFYFEGNSLQDVLDLSLFAEPNEDLLSRAKLLFKSNFAGFLMKSEDDTYLSYIFIPKDITLAEEVFAEYITEEWKFAIIDDYMLVTSNEAVFPQVKAVDDGIKRSLVQIPDYVRQNKELPEIGQFKVFFVSGDSRGILRNLLGGLTQETIGMINKVLISELNSLVISNLDAKH
jgi:hypothetical protein